MIRWLRRFLEAQERAALAQERWSVAVSNHYEIANEAMRARMKLDTSTYAVVEAEVAAIHRQLLELNRRLATPSRSEGDPK